MQISIGSRFFRLPNVFRQDVYAVITGKQLRDAVISGANSILKNRKFVDDLNIFPVPDGDTGTNMSMTIGAGSDAMQSRPSSSQGSGKTISLPAPAAMIG